MQIITTKKQLLPALLRVASVIENKTTKPILSNILFVVNDQELTLIGTDSAVEIAMKLHINSDSEGSFTVPAKKILDVCKALEDEATIRINTEDDKITVISGRGRYRISTLPADEYPVFDTPLPTITIGLASKDLGDLLHKTLFSMAVQDVRYYLNGMLLDIKPMCIRAVATDGHRLALGELALKIDSEETLQCIVPRKSILELSRLLQAMGNGDEAIQLSLSNSHISVYFGQGRFISKLMDGRYPDYEKVIPGNEGYSVVADRIMLKHALHRSSILSNQKLKGVKFELSQDSLILIAHNSENEESVEELEVSYSGENMSIGFNINYVLDVLNVLDTEQINIQISADSSTSVITGVGDSQSKYIVMPMHI